MHKKNDRISIDKLHSSERIELTTCPVCAVGHSRHYAIIESLNFFQCDSCQSVLRCVNENGTFLVCTGQADRVS